MPSSEIWIDSSALLQRAVRYPGVTSPGLDGQSGRLESSILKPGLERDHLCEHVAAPTWIDPTLRAEILDRFNLSPVTADVKRYLNRSKPHAI
jgi:hypothetical protein